MTAGGSPLEASLAALLANEALGLKLVAGPGDKRFTGVTWADREADRGWLAPNDLRIAVAAGRANRPLPDPLLRNEPAVIVYALTPSDRRLPEQLVARASDAGVALVSAPPSVAPERVEEAALRELVRASAPAGPLFAAPQAYLLAGMADPKPERGLLERTNRLTGVDLVLLSPWGEVVARAGAGGWRPRQEAAGASPVTQWPEGKVRLGGRAAHLYRVESAGRLRGVLLAFEASSASTPWLRLTRSLLIAAAEVRAADVRAEVAAGSALLAAWLAVPASADRFAPDLARAGFEGGITYRAAVAEVTEAQAGTVQEAGVEYFQQRGLPALTVVQGPLVTWVFVVPSRDSPGGGAHANALQQALSSALNTPHAGARLGVSQPHGSLDDVATARRQAVLALGGKAAGSGVVAFDDLDPVAWLLEQPQADLELLRRRTLGRLLDADRGGKLAATLTAYLEAPSDLARLADRLGIHVNTLRYRLKRIEELVGAPLSSPETLARLWLATR